MVITTSEWICDRCGKKMDKKPIYLFKVRPGKKLIKWDSERGIYRPLDVCRKCEEEFAEWWEGGENG